MFSFKLKLVLYFLLLSLLPLVAAFAGFSALEERSQTRLADARLEGGLRGALAAYQADLAATERDAHALGASKAVQEALREGDVARLRALVRPHPHVRVTSTGGARVGAIDPADPRREVVVIDSARRAPGTVTAAGPRGRGLARPLPPRARLDADLRLVLL